jgi:HSP20 family protein
VECDGEYRVTAELPGMTAENIDIKLSDGTMTIRGEKSEEKKEEKEDYLVSERRYGEFQRILSIPSGVDAEAVSADFANGVLTVTLPKTPEAKQKERKVEVKSAA